jgi:membrane protease YdiL (CAAX protease family)
MFGAALLSLIILGTLGGFFLGWSLAIVYRLFSGQPSPFAPKEGEAWSAADVLREGCHRLWTGQFLPWTPRRHVPWMWFDMLIVGLPVLLLIALPMIAGEPPKKANAPPIKLEQFQMAVVLDSGLKLGYLLLATTYLIVRARATLRDLGFAWRELGQNVLIGIIAFPMIAVPVYFLQAMIVWFGGWAYQHPLIEMLQQKPDFGLFALLAISACMVAPLSEEWFFRVVFQGWLERACAWVKGRLDAERPLPGVIDLKPAMPLGDEALNPYAVTAAVPAWGEPIAAEVQPLSAAPKDMEAREEPVQYVLVHWVPILLSSVLFGLAHFGHGPAPITLTVLAVALGYLYQRTHSIVPVIVVHALFNSVSMLLFYVTMFELHRPLLP